MYRDDKFETIPVPENLDEVIDQGIQIGVKMKKKRFRKKIIAASGSAAAAIAVFSFVCISFPTLAAKIPFIGNIFSTVEEQVSYKGDYSSVAKKLVTETETSPENGSAEQVPENKYVQTSNGITVTVSEVYYNSMAMYLALNIYNEEEFPADFVRTENMQDYNWDYDTLQLRSEEISDFYSDPAGFYYIEGKFIDAHTFAGIVRVDLAHATYWPTLEEIEAAGITEDALKEEGLSSEEFESRAQEHELKIKEAFPNAGETIEFPEKFTYHFNIKQLSGELFETEESKGIDEDGNEIVFHDPIEKVYKGNWDFELEVEIDPSKTQTVEVNGTNEDGIGIGIVEKTPYEIKASEIFPSEEMKYDTFVAICDKNGDLLDFQGDIADTYQVYGRDTSTINVYVCDYTQYMDELKGYYWSDDYDEKKKTKTFASYLEEHALYSTQVSFDE